MPSASRAFSARRAVPLDTPNSTANRGSPGTGMPGRYSPSAILRDHVNELVIARVGITLKNLVEVFEGRTR